MSAVSTSERFQVPFPDDELRISVVVPTYLEEILVTRLLRQFTPALKREYRFEVVVSDGGSTDGTVEIARQHSDRVIENRDRHRQTIGEGRNRGADAARGRLLVFLNADVTLRDPPGFFRHISDVFLDSRVIAATCAVRVDPLEEMPFDRFFHRFFNSYCRFLNFIGIGMGRGEVQAIRRDVFREVGGYNETLPAAEDFDLFRRLRRKGVVRFLPETCVYESPRRYRAQGYPRVVASWMLNALSVMIRGRSRSGEWTPIR